LKRHILVKLAKKDYYHGNPERQDYIEQKYSKHILPLEEAEWYGLELNEACKRLQDIEDNSKPRPLKEVYEEKLLQEFAANDEAHNVELRSQPERSKLKQWIFPN
jgi:hypothetical protein